MSMIDRQRVSAVQVIEALGYTFTAAGWVAPAGLAPTMLDEADAMHALLMLRADKLVSCTEMSDEQSELALITDTLEAYEARRWPGGKIAGGKG